MRAAACLLVGLSLAAAALVPPPTDPVARLFRTLFPPNAGKSIAFGVFQRDVDAAAVPSDDERAELRRVAAEELTNIGAEERDRRRLAGAACSAATAALGAALLAAHAPAAARLALFAPVYVSSGFLASSETGL